MDLPLHTIAIQKIDFYVKKLVYLLCEMRERDDVGDRKWWLTLLLLLLLLNNE